MGIRDNVRFVEGLEIFHNLYIPDGPYKSNVPRLVREIVERLDPEDPAAMRKEMLRVLGRRGGRKTQTRSSSSSSSSLPLFPGA
jgi:hypothetical protein